jgi:hypothetical protein
MCTVLTVVHTVRPARMRRLRRAWLRQWLRAAVGGIAAHRAVAAAAVLPLVARRDAGRRRA